MNYNNIFAPTARVERFIKSHAQNLPTYGLILAVVALTAISAAINFLSEQYDRIPEHEIRIRLYTVKLKRSVVRYAISTYSFVSYNGIDTKVQRLAAVVLKVWGNRGRIVRVAMDKVFCLG